MRIILAAVILALFISACSRRDAAPPPREGTIQAAVSIAPMAWFVERVGGEHVHVTTLVGPGQNPHTYEATPRQVASASTADIYFSTRWPFETPLLAKIREMNPKLRVVDAAEGIAFRALTAEEAAAGEHDHDHHHGHNHARHEAHGHAETHAAGDPDPHIWMSPRLAKNIAANIAASLKKIDAAHAEEYDRNLAALHADLDRVDAKIAEALAPLKGREFMVFHPAFGYFGDAYGLKQVPVEIEGKEPGPRQLAEFIERARKAGVRVIFVQPQFSSKSAEAVAQAIGGAVVPMDDLPRDYLRNLEDMAEKLTRALAPRNGR